MINRRDFLFCGSLSLAALAAPGAWATPDNGSQLLPLRPGEVLGDPDFSLLATDWAIAGLRPCRKGGVKLEVDRGTDIAKDRKVLIHNFGHGGAGITLAWGCADQVRELAQVELRDRLQKPPAAAKVIVVGAGAIGLATAAELKRWMPAMDVMVVADNVDAAGNPVHNQTTSWKAGGQFEPSGLWREYFEHNTLPVLHDLVRRSSVRIRELSRQGIQADYGIADRKNYLLASGDARGFELGIPCDVVPAARTGLLPFAQLSNDVGKEYSTWLINPTILLPKLVSDLRAANVRFEKRKLSSRAQLLALEADIVVNCTGLGARDILHGTGLTAMRGQLVVLQNPAQLDYLFSGGCGADTAYMFCRQNDIVIGGTFEAAESLDVPEASYRTILKRMQRIFNGDITACRHDAGTTPDRQCTL